jgi:hypothetical protein
MTGFRFLKEGRDSFIDFVKGFAIVSVVILHNLGHTSVSKYLLFNLWIGQAVPLFILISAVNTYRAYMDVGYINICNYFRSNLVKILRRVFVPFFLLQIILFPFFFLLENGDLHSWFQKVLTAGGLGPGSYYPWIFLQIIIVVPFVIFTVKKLGFGKSILIWLAVSIVLELCAFLFNLNEDSYRMMSIRYIFLLVCGIYVMQNGFRPNKTTILLSVLGVLFILIDSYTSFVFYPVAFKSLGFTGQHWPAYIYVSILLLWILYQTHRILPKCISKLLEFYGKGFLSDFFDTNGSFLYPSHIEI